MSLRSAQSTEQVPEQVLQSKFQNSQGYTEKLCLNPKANKTKIKVKPPSVTQTLIPLLRNILNLSLGLKSIL